MKKFIVVFIFVSIIVISEISTTSAPVLPEGATDEPGENGVVFSDVTEGEHTISKNIKNKLYYFSITVSKSNEKNGWEYISRWTATYPVDTIWIKGQGGDTEEYIDYTINKNNYYGESDIEYTSAYETPTDEVDIKSVILWFAEEKEKEKDEEKTPPEIIYEKIPPETSDSMTFGKSNMFLLFALSSLLVIIYIKLLMKKL
jgi:hypothetical protein